MSGAKLCVVGVAVAFSLGCGTDWLGLARDAVSVGKAADDAVTVGKALNVAAHPEELEACAKKCIDAAFACMDRECGSMSGAALNSAGCQQCSTDQIACQTVCNGG